MILRYIQYDGPRPDEEFLQAVRVEMEEGAHSMRRAQESVPAAQGSEQQELETWDSILCLPQMYGLQLTGKGRRLQKEEPVALERLVAVDVNQRSIDGYTSLHVATAAGNAEMVSLLLESRADVSLSTVHRSELPIHFAAQGGYDIVLRLLVEPTKARGLLDVGTVTGWNALHLAVAGQHQGAENCCGNDSLYMSGGESQPDHQRSIAAQSCASEAARPSLGHQLMQMKMETTSAARSHFSQHIRTMTALPLRWTSVRKFPKLPTRQPSRCQEVGRHFPELVSGSSMVLDTYEAYACMQAADTFLVDPAIALTAELGELKAGCINVKPWPQLRFAANETHAEFLYRSCNDECRAEAWDQIPVRMVGEDLLVISSMRFVAEMQYQHILLDFAPQAWTVLNFVKNSSRKVLTHSPAQTQMLQTMGVEPANIMEVPFTDGPDPNFLLCVEPSRSMHLWRVSDDGRTLPTFAYGDRRPDADLWHRMINWQVGHEIAHSVAKRSGWEDLATMPGRVVFLQRCSAHRPIINEQAALALTSRVFLAMNRSEGVLSICPGRMDFLDQMRETRSARLVIGEHGGALSNAMFLQPDAGLIEFVGSAEAHAGLSGYWPPYKSYWYGGSGAALKFFRAVLYEPDAAGAWNIRLDDLEEAIKRWMAQEPIRSRLAS
ncbi:Ank2 [Symbiodinium pilosum]|uniref:Ank2 protein n=1 Tax=Symbiodinium pilosum TaxID=2952 RepID=A0A812RTK0_SYMPI|nr:Ank2 [Symbiodinium pilosum]